MAKHVYISADYDWDNGDRNVVDELNKWGKDDLHKVDFVDMAKVVSGSVSNDPDCRPCDLKAEFNRQINLSSVVIFVIGDKTAKRTSGSYCRRNYTEWNNCICTPYKQNPNGSKYCKHFFTSPGDSIGDVGNINTYSYLRHEFEQAIRKNKQILIIYNSKYKQPSWLPSYMSSYEKEAIPFWTTNWKGEKVGDYHLIKKALGYE